MKKRLLFTALLLSACSQLPSERSAEVDTLVVPGQSSQPDVAEEVVIANSDTTESVATDFEHIFVDSDMTFTGTLPCADCPGISYHLNLFRDDRFEVREEYLDGSRVDL